MLYFKNSVPISSVVVLAFVSMFQLVSCVPINAHELIVFNPTITVPNESVAWPRGSRHTVRWKTKGIPQESLNNTGLILLGYMESDSDSENLDIDNPLASGFPIGVGSVQVTMPHDIPPRDDYFVVLFGDSGNRSQKFKIH